MNTQPYAAITSDLIYRELGCYLRMQALIYKWSKGRAGDMFGFYLPTHPHYIEAYHG